MASSLHLTMNLPNPHIPKQESKHNHPLKCTSFSEFFSAILHPSNVYKMHCESVHKDAHVC